MAKWKWFAKHFFVFVFWACPPRVKTILVQWESFLGNGSLFTVHEGGTKKGKTSRDDEHGHGQTHNKLGGNTKNWYTSRNFPFLTSLTKLAATSIMKQCVGVRGCRVGRRTGAVVESYSCGSRRYCAQATRDLSYNKCVNMRRAHAYGGLITNMVQE